MGPACVDQVEDIIQDTLEKALNSWKIRGVPANPEGWLYTVARNQAIDVLRNQKKRVDSAAGEISEAPVEDFEKSVDDSVLRLMFACCHPAIATEAQIAFTLKTLGGLTVYEIAAGFDLPEETIAKRIYRAKEKFRMLRTLEAPSLYELEGRLNAVLQVLYLMFNEGYYSSNPNMVVRDDICAEALRLAVLLANNGATARPKVHAVVALMCFHAARLPARVNDQNQIVLLEHQDRALWNRPLIARGVEYLNRASSGAEVSEFHLEAAIASFHTLAATFEETKWNALLKCHDQLYQLKPLERIALNRAIVLGYAQSAEAAIEALEKIESCNSNRFCQVALGDFNAKKGLTLRANHHYANALALSKSEFEQKLIQEKLGQLAEG